MIRKLVATAVVMLAVASGVAAAAPSYPATIALPRGFQPEGIAIRANTFYVGSIPTGSIYRGNLRTGTGSVFIQRSGRAAIGVEADNRSRLFVAGGPTGKAFVYNARTGADIASYDLAPGFINDVVVTRTGAYFTNSNLAELYRVPIGNDGRLGSTVQTIALKPPYAQGAGFNVNGIDATPNGRWLVIVQSNTGKLFRVNPSTGATVEIALGGEDVMNGDGILLDGKTLYVVQNHAEQDRGDSPERGTHGRCGSRRTSKTRASPCRRRSTTSVAGSTPSMRASARRLRRPTTRSCRSASPTAAEHSTGGRRAAPARQIIRRSAAQRVSSWRLESCSLRSTLETWLSTVLTERCRLAAISL